MSVRTKLILIFLSLSVVPLAALTFMSYSNSLNSMRDLVERDNRDAAEAIQARVTALNDSIRDRVVAITQLPEMQALTPGVPLQSEQGAQLAQAMQREVGESWSLFSDLEFQPAIAPAPPVPPALPAPATRSEPHAVELGQLLAPLVESADRAAASEDSEVWSMKVILPDFSNMEQEGEGKSAATLRQYELNFVDGVPTTETVEALTGGIVENMVRLPGFLLQTGESGEIRLRNLGSDLRQQLMDETAKGETEVAQVDLARERKADLLRRFDAQSAEAGQAIVLPVEQPEGAVGSVIARIRPDRLLAQVFSGVAVGENEIAFAVDGNGILHTRRPEDMAVLGRLGLAQPAAGDGPVYVADADPRRLAELVQEPDWISVIEANPETGYVFGVVRKVSSELNSIRSAALLNLFLGFAFIGMAGSGVIVFSHRMTMGLEALTDGARRIASGDLGHRILARRKDELGQLASAFNEMAVDLEASRLSLLAQERVRRELEIARTIQRDSLPREPFTSSAVQIFGRSIPSHEVGGDFYNFLPLADGRIAILVGDVSGKGVPAALLMAEVQATLRTMLQFRPDLGHAMEQLNQEVCQTKPDNVYLTLFLGILDSEMETFTYVNAGHTPPFIVRSGDGSIDNLASTSRPVGLLEDSAMQVRHVDVAAGDLLCVFTDGVEESAESRGEEFFGVGRIEAAVRSNFDAPLPDMLDEVARRLTAFHGGDELEDDATLVLARFTHSPQRRDSQSERRRSAGGPAEAEAN